MSLEIGKRISEAITRSDKLRAETESLRVEWTELVQGIFALLLKARIRPTMVRVQAESVTRYFRIDWNSMDLVETRLDDFVVDVADIDKFGNLIGSRNETQEQGSSDNVSGIASTF
jgi:hypothetical protein